MNLGIHCSVRKGFLDALLQARALQCRTLQVFPRKPGDPMRFLPESELEEIRKFRSEQRIISLAVHSVYQPNIASANEKIWARSRDSLREELRFAHALGAEFLVIHSGSYSPDSDLRAGLKKSGRTIRGVLNEIHGPAKILIENVPGGARRMGSTFEELRILLAEIGLEESAGICLDTAHAFAAGYPLQTAAGMDDCLALFDKQIGLEFLQLFHINDSAAELNSHKDIHEHIGRGKIGFDPLKKLVTDPRFSAKSGILETPKLPLGSDRKNLDLLGAGA